VADRDGGMSARRMAASNSNIRPLPFTYLPFNRNKQWEAMDVDNGVEEDPKKRWLNDIQMLNVTASEGERHARDR